MTKEEFDQCASVVKFMCRAKYDVVYNDILRPGNGVDLMCRNDVASPPKANTAGRTLLLQIKLRNVGYGVEMQITDQNGMIMTHIFQENPVTLQLDRGAFVAAVATII